MNKLLTFGAILIVLALVFGAVGFAYAQTQTPPSNRTYGQGMMGGGGWNGSDSYGPGMMRRGGGGSGGMMGGYGRQAGDDAYGPIHTYMVAAFAVALGTTPEELQAKLDSGETMWSLAQAEGLGSNEFDALMVDARTQAVQAAVTDGVISQQQADWMNQRMTQMQANGYGPGSCPMHGGAPAGNSVP